MTPAFNNPYQPGVDSSAEARSDVEAYLILAGTFFQHSLNREVARHTRAVVKSSLAQPGDDDFVAYVLIYLRSVVDQRFRDVSEERLE